MLNQINLSRQKLEVGGKEETEGVKAWVGRGEQLEGRRKGWTNEVMEQKHIKLQSRGQDSQQRETKHPHKQQQDGTARLAIIIQAAAEGSEGIQQYTI